LVRIREGTDGDGELAVSLDLEGVAVHVNVSSKFETEMFSILATAIRAASTYDVPVVAIMYPRREAEDGSDENYLTLKSSDRRAYTSLVAHAARVGMEMGADVIKTQYTGDSETFRKVVEACAPVPAIVAGGPALNL